jgi:hypothetical protein
MLEEFDLPPVDLDDPEVQRVWGDGFEIETLINVRIAVAQARITEVGSRERRRVFGESNLHAVRDGLRVLRTILVERKAGTRREPRAVRARSLQRGPHSVVLPESGPIPVSARLS